MRSATALRPRGRVSWSFPGGPTSPAESHPCDPFQPAARVGVELGSDSLKSSPTQVATDARPPSQSFTACLVPCEAMASSCPRPASRPTWACAPWVVERAADSRRRLPRPVCLCPQRKRAGLVSALLPRIRQAVQRGRRPGAGVEWLAGVRPVSCLLFEVSGTLLGSAEHFRAAPSSDTCPTRRASPSLLELKSDSGFRLGRSIQLSSP